MSITYAVLPAFFQKIKNVSNEKYLFWTTLIFFLLLLITNLSNKPIIASFLVLFIIYYLKLKKFDLSLFFTFISSSIVTVGKTYHMLLVPPGIFSTEIFPFGYFSNLVITTSSFLAFAMLIYILRQLTFDPKAFKINKTDILIFIFYALKILSAIFGSKNPALSLPFELLSLANLVVYIYARFLFKSGDTLWKNLTYLIAALVVFESLLGFKQLVGKSPIGKNLEFQISIEYYGHAADETQFSFRPVGTFDHANTLGIWTAAMTTFLFIHAFKRKSWTLWFSFLAGASLTVVTISRSAWLGLGASLIFSIYYISKNYNGLVSPFVGFLSKWKWIIIPVSIFLFVFFIIPRAKNSLYSFQGQAGGGWFRYIQNKDAIMAIGLHPLIGIGDGMEVFEGMSLNSNTFEVDLPLQVHNWYIGTALKNGIPALFTFAFFIALSLQKIFEAKKLTLIALSVSSTIICLLLAAIFQPIINLNIILLLLSLFKDDRIGRKVGSYAKEIT